MFQILLFAGPLVAGALLRGRIRSRPFHRAVTDVFFPALILELLLSDPPAGEAVVAGFGALLFHVVLLAPLGWAAARLLRRDVGEALLPVAFMNSGFLGIPATLFFAGPAAARYAVLYDQAMTIVIYTFGLALVLPGGARRGVWEVLLAPPFWAFLVALGLGRAGLLPGEAVLTAVGWVGRLTVPVALFAVGLDLSGRRDDLAPAAALAGLRLAGGALAAIVAIACLRAAGGALGLVAQDPNFARMIWIEGIMPSAVFSAVLPARYGAGGTLAATTVLLSTLLFLPWMLLLQTAAPAAFLP